MKTTPTTGVNMAPFAIRTQREVAQIMGCSKNTVIRCEKRALAKMRRALVRLNIHSMRVS